MKLPSWLFSPAFWPFYWAAVGLLVLVLLYFSIANALRKIEEAETELDENEHMTRVGSNMWIIFPDFHDPDKK